MHGRILTLALVLAGALAVAPASADPQSDFNHVYGDWKGDGVITQCLWSQAELQNAYDVATGNPDFQYDTRFTDAVQVEIKRWKGGGCSAVLGTVRRASPLTGAKIASVRGRGGPARELVTIRNTTGKALAFRKASLRNSKRGRAAFPSGFRLAKGKTATVHVGCAAGRRRPSYVKTTVWLCHKKALFADKGDLARLADPKGVVVSQRGYGSLKRRPVF